MKTLPKAYLSYLLVGCLSIVLWWPSSMRITPPFFPWIWLFAPQINLLLQNQYNIFPIIQKPFLNPGFFSKFVLLNDHTIYNMENFHFSILSLLSFFFHFFLSFFHSFLPSFFFLSFLLFLFCRSGQNQRKIQEWIAVLYLGV